MPQDIASWDRKDLLRQRKHERSEQPFDSVFRWRNSSTTSSSSHYVPREFSRWGSGDLRRPPGHGHGYAPSRSNARTFEDNHYRPSASRGEWIYDRNNRGDRASFGQRDWKCHTWDANNGSLSAFGRPYDMNNNQWSADERSSHLSDPHASQVDSWGQASMRQKVIEVEPLKVSNDQNLVDQGLSLSSDAHSVHVGLSEQSCLEVKHDNNVYSQGKQCHDMKCEQRSANDSSLHASNSHVDLDGTSGRLRFKDQLDSKDRSNIAKRLGRESSLGSIDWKHPIWPRSGSFASRGSGFSHSNSSKSLGVVDSIDQTTEFLPKNVSVIESPSGDATACLSSPHPSEEMNSRKKPRLGWGEGLAKYEKKKVEVPVVKTNGDGTTVLANSMDESNPPDTNLVDKSPPVVSVSDYGSPATPSSVACSSLPGMEDKSVNAANRVSNLCNSPSPVHDSHVKRCHFNFGKLHNISAEKFSCLLDQLLLNGDSGPEDGLTAMNKVLTLKTDILKALEMTESEVDSLENELRVLKFETGSDYPDLAGSSSILCVVNANMSEEQEAPYSFSLQQASCLDEAVEKVPFHNSGIDKVHPDANDGGADGPEAATSKLTEPLSLFQGGSLSQFVDSSESSRDSLEKIFTSSSEVKMPAFAHGFPTAKEEIDLLSSDGCGVVSDGEDMLCAKIFASNRKSASEACEVFNKLLPREVSGVDGSRLFGVCQMKDDAQVKRKIEMRRWLLRVKERIVASKFKAFRYSWKKDLHQLSITKYNPKSQKQYDTSLHAKNNGHQKLPHNTRLRFSCPATGRVSLAPSTELLNYMGKLPLDTQWKPCRDVLRMPALIFDEKERANSRFISSNGLVEDPCVVEKERALINPWTLEEREIFLNKLAVVGKDFRKIASYLEHKTTADCVDFYYKNHKSDYFEKTKKKLAFSKEQKCTYLLAPQKKWKREANAASLNLLGAVSAIAANASKVASHKQMSSKRINLGSCSSSKSHSGNSFEGRLHNFALPHREAVAADVLAGVGGPFSSDPLSSCTRSSLDSGGKYKAHLKLDPTVKQTQLSDATHNHDGSDDDDTCSEESLEQTGPIHWTDEERSAFIQAFSLYGKNFAMLSRFVGTRSRDQCKVFYSKARKCLGLESVQPLSGNGSTSASSDNSDGGDGSDTEDPCVVESSSVIRNDDLWAEIDLNSPSPCNINQDGVGHSGPVTLKSESNRSGLENGVACLKWKDNAKTVDSIACLHGDFPATEVQRIRNDHLMFKGTKDGSLSSSVVSARPTSSSPPILANLIGENLPERQRKESGGQSALLPRHCSDDHDSMMHATNRIVNPSIHAEAKSSSDFSASDCLHHVPIEVCMGDPVGVHMSREISSTRSDSESPISLAATVFENDNLDRQSLAASHLQSGEKRQFLGHVKHKQSHSKKYKVDNSWSSSMQDQDEGDIAGNIGSKEIKGGSTSDGSITTLHTGKGFFSLRKCSSLTALKHQRISHKENKSGHSRSHSYSLSDTERPQGNGDVKLFGTILTSPNDKGINQISSNPRQTVRTTTLKPAFDGRNGKGTDYGNINQHDLQNVPITSYGFWDGNRIRTGLASLADPVTLLAKYPDAVASHLGASALEQRAGNSNVIQPGGLSVYKRREISGSKQSTTSSE